MKTKWLAMAGVILSISPFSLAIAGGHSGNGGGAFICTDPSKSEFLDLFEAQLTVQSGGLGLQIPTSNDPVDVQIQNAFNRLNPGSGLYKRTLQVYAEVKSATIDPTDPGANISWPADEKNPLTMVGCQPLGIMLYSDSDNSILQDQQSLKSLPATQQAAAWVHETIYKLLRETQGDTDSIRARKIVGHLFSNESQDQIDKALRQIDYTLMAVENDRVFATLSSDGFPHVNLHLSVSHKMYVYIQEADPKCAGNDAMVTYLGTQYPGKTGENIAININPFAAPDNMLVSSKVCKGSSIPYATIYIKGSSTEANPLPLAYGSHDMSPNDPIFGGDLMDIMPVKNSSW